MINKSRQNRSNLVSFVLLSYCFFYNDPFYLVGYTADDVTYKWTTGRGVNIASDMKLSQFDLISTPTGTETTLRNQGKPLLASLLSSCHFASIIILLYCSYHHHCYHFRYSFNIDCEFSSAKAHGRLCYSGQSRNDSHRSFLTLVTVGHSNLGRCRSV